ncbi:hypothetical protein BT63DRAFT_418239 [Microthyrium microscopicum]|uniref:Uncharacterized protein n=1 Tax=Microthyrium microscopicum TaxID=703497 RepID=A0A6A6TZK4_9PEZI|nr:hypothetical protein BT63DRAFT_418239 [Microthyrium microscopicum]
MGKDRNGKSRREKGLSKRQDKEPELKTETKVISDEPIWAYQNLQKDQFYAALYFFTYSKSTQPTDYLQNAAVAMAGDARNQLLDKLALLFARYRNSEKMDRYGCPPEFETKTRPSTTAENVTAIALEMPPEPDRHIKQRSCNWTFWIAKNRGSQDFDAMNDDIFAKKLERWYNDFEGPLILNVGDEIWSDVQQFWMRRSCYYFEILQKLRSKWFPVAKDPLYTTEPPPKLLEYFSAMNPANVRTDWEHVWSLIEKLKFNSNDWKQSINDYVNCICFEDTQTWRESQYARYGARSAQAGNGEEDSKTNLSTNQLREKSQIAKEFREAIICLQLLRTPKSVLEKFLNFRHRQQNATSISIRFLPVTNVDKLKAERIHSTIKAWYGEKVKNVDGQKLFALDGARSNLTFKQHSKLVLRKLPREAQEIHTSFHCELQLLGKFMTNKNVHMYFGCSKLSCYLCWAVLTGSRFRTRGSHGEISPDCVFPFQFSGEDEDKSYNQLAEALKRVETHFLERIRDKASRDDYLVTDHLAITQTQASDAAFLPYGPHQVYKNTYIFHFKESDIPDTRHRQLMNTIHARNKRPALGLDPLRTLTPVRLRTLCKPGQMGYRLLRAVEIPPNLISDMDALLLSTDIAFTGVTEKHTYRIPKVENPQNSLWITNFKLDQLSQSLREHHVKRNSKQGLWQHDFLVDQSDEHYKSLSYKPALTFWRVQGYPTSLVNWKDRTSMQSPFTARGKFFVYEAPSSESVLHNELATEYIQKGWWHYIAVRALPEDPVVVQFAENFSSAKTVLKWLPQENKYWRNWENHGRASGIPTSTNNRDLEQTESLIISSDGEEFEFEATSSVGDLLYEGDSEGARSEYERERLEMMKPGYKQQKLTTFWAKDIWSDEEQDEEEGEEEREEMDETEMINDELDMPGIDDREGSMASDDEECSCFLISDK